MAFERKMVGDALVLTPRKNLVGGEETLSLLKAIDDVANVGPAKVVMDLGEISWVSSLGVGLLRKASITCDHSGGWLRLARTGRIIENTLNVTGLIIYFEIFDTVDLAVAAPSTSRHPALQRRSSETPEHRDA
jgi:anti-sigma B factor antagonist